jgi:hypothetical protein
MHLLKAAFGIAAVVTGIAGCYGGTPTSSSSGGSGEYVGGYATEDAGPAATPVMLAFVDTGRTLTVTPGQGVGVFVTYQAGGTWLIQWTCDTTITNESCDFAINVGVAVGPPSLALLPNTVGSGETVQLVAADPTEPAIQIMATTSAQQEQVSFTTSPGATINVGVQLGGLPSSQYFFFVQNGQVNGGYTGSLSDPLEFQPTSP